MHNKLPHISLKEYYQFITFRTQDSVDDYVCKIQDDVNLNNKIKQFKIDEYLDKSNKGAYLFGDNIDIVKNVILDPSKNAMYEVDALVVMPNHVHMLIKQKDDVSKIMRYIKGKSAIELNKNLGKNSKFWLNNYFDKLIRDQKHYNLVYEYILNNPLKTGLKDAEERIYSKY